MRKIHDFYFKKAKAESYLARSVYKLEEIDRRYGLLKRGMKVLDIGCAPGSWSQYLLKRIGNGTVTGVDLRDRVTIGDPRFRYVRADIFELMPQDLSTLQASSPTAGSTPIHDPTPDAGLFPAQAQPRQRTPVPRATLYDLITCDAAPDTSGNRFVDSERSLNIVKRVFELAREVLKPGGTVLAKVFQGEDLKGFTDSLRREYGKVALSKPQSSRKESRELYIIACERRAGSD